MWAIQVNIDTDVLLTGFWQTKMLITSAAVHKLISRQTNNIWPDSSLIVSGGFWPRFTYFRSPLSVGTQQYQLFIQKLWMTYVKIWHTADSESCTTTVPNLLGQCGWLRKLNSTLEISIFIWNITIIVCYIRRSSVCEYSQLIILSSGMRIYCNIDGRLCYPLVISSQEGLHRYNPTGNYTAVIWRENDTNKKKKDGCN